MSAPTQYWTRLAYACAAYGYTTRDVAESMGVSRSRASRWLTGEVVPPPEYRASLARALGISEAVLFPIRPTNGRVA